MNLQKLYSPSKRRVYKMCVFAALLILMTSAATIPFIWESKSLWYKVGVDRTLLQAGKIAGICAAILLFFQILLALRLRFLDRIFALDRLYHLHKQAGLAILTLAVLHASLIIVPEGIKNLPIGWKFWPEMLGGAILLLLFAFVGTALFRKRLMPYYLWRKVHRPMGYLIAFALSVHIFNVSDSFEKSIPNYALWTLVGAVLFIVILAKIRSFYGSRRRLTIKSCDRANDDILSIEVTAPLSFAHAPGQFAFLRLFGNDISPEAHPFTISSAPQINSSQDGTLQFYIKKCGDWTENISPEKIRHASIEGPFGLFSYKAQPPADLIVFIAGGIGITPLLSMLRQLSCEENNTKIMLIWSVSRKKDVFLDVELSSLKEKLTQLTIHICYSQEPGGRRLDLELLSHYLQSVPDKTHFYICGPELMMVQTQKNLKDLGHAAKSIFWERFAL